MRVTVEEGAEMYLCTVSYKLVFVVADLLQYRKSAAGGQFEHGMGRMWSNSERSSHRWALLYLDCIPRQARS